MRALLRDPEQDCWIEYGALAGVLQAATPMDVAPLLEQVEARARREGLHAVGFVSYEAARGLDAKLSTRDPAAVPCAWFGLFRAAAPVPAPEPARHPGLDWQPSLDAAGYAAAIQRIRDYIAAGDTYQVNFSYRLRARLDAAADPEAVFRSMLGSQPCGLGAFLETEHWAVCCASPELFFERRGRRVTSRPMKGTAGRGANPAEDEARARWLEDSAKNRAENLMITDMVRNDIGRLADVGSVRTAGLFRLESHPTVWQMTSTVHGDSDASIAELFRALFPAASITGAPKRRTMEIITELEQAPRGIYTGSIGVIAPNGDARFNVAIRTAWIDSRRRTAEYGVGGGILWDSDAADEHAETRTKARILASAADPDFALLETLLWQPGRGYRMLEAHLERLATAARRFHRPWRRQAIATALARQAESYGPRPQRVRLLVDGGGAPSITASPLEALPRPHLVAVAPLCSDVLDNPFVSCKTSRRDVYDDARAAALAHFPALHDVLLCNARGELTESTIANLVLDLDGRLLTPAESCGLLPGLYRRHLLDSGVVAEAILRPRDLRSARAVYLVNSVRGRWPVTVLGR